MNEHSAHLPKRRQLVGKELEALLAQNCVKAGIRQSQIEGTALEPFDRRAHGRRERPCHGDHSRVEVDPNDPSGRTDTLRSNTRHEAGAAGDVQHALATAESGGIDQQRRPRSEDVPGGVALVELGRLGRHLPLLVLAHLPFHPSLRDIRSAVCVIALIWS